MYREGSGSTGGAALRLASRAFSGPGAHLGPGAKRQFEGPRGPAQGGGLVLPCWVHPLITELGQSICGKVRLRLSVRVRVR